MAEIRFHGVCAWYVSLQHEAGAYIITDRLAEVSLCYINHVKYMPRTTGSMDVKRRKEMNNGKLGS